MSLEDFLAKTYGLPNPLNPQEVNSFCDSALKEHNLTNEKLDELACQHFSGYGKAPRSLNESQADTLHDLLLLLKKRVKKA